MSSRPVGGPSGAPPVLSRSGLRELVERHDAARGESVLREGPRARVTRVASDGGDEVLVKEERGGGLLRLCARLLGGGRAGRSFRVARALRAAGIAAPEPLGVVCRPGRALVAFRFLPGLDLQQALGRWGGREPEATALACAATSLAAQLHGAGFAPRDLKPPNLILLDGPPGEGQRLGQDDPPRLALIDLDDVRCGRPTRREVIRNLAALDAYAKRLPSPLGVRARARAFDAYAAARGLDRAARAALLKDVLLASRAKALRPT